MGNKESHIGSAPESTEETIDDSTYPGSTSFTHSPYDPKPDAITPSIPGLPPISPIMPYHFDTQSIPKVPQYVFEIDTNKSRPFTQRLTYTTGTGYILGLSTGGIWGLGEGIVTIRKLQEASGKVKITALLNSVTRRGPFIANNFGIVTMYFAISEQIFRRVRSESDQKNKLLAAISAGILWKCTKSVRATVLAAIFGGTIAGSYILIDKNV